MCSLVQRQSRDVISPSRFLQARFNPLEFANSSKHLERLWILFAMKRVDGVKLNDDIRIDPSNWYGFFNQLELEHHSTRWYIVHHIISLYKLEPMYSNFIDIPFQDKKKTAHLLESKESTTLSSMTHKFPKTSIDRILLPHSTIREQSNRFPTCTQPERRSR